MRKVNAFYTDLMAELLRQGGAWSAFLEVLLIWTGLRRAVERSSCLHINMHKSALRWLQGNLLLDGTSLQRCGFSSNRN